MIGRGRPLASLLLLAGILVPSLAAGLIATSPMNPLAAIEQDEPSGRALPQTTPLGLPGAVESTTTTGETETENTLPSTPRPGAAALESLVTGLLDEDRFTQIGLSRLLDGHFHEIGLDAVPLDFGAFEQTATLSFAYPLGDIDGDGVDDVALNLYCTDLDACSPLGGGAGFPPSAVATQGQDPCRSYYRAQPTQGPVRDFAIPNKLYGVSGATGEILWAVNQTQREWSTKDPAGFAEHAANLLCPFDFIVGSVPRETGGHDLLGYRFAMYPRPLALGSFRHYPMRANCPHEAVADMTNLLNNGVVDCRYALIRHEIYVLDRNDGHARWSHGENGTMLLASTDTRLNTVSPMAYHLRADNWLLNPLLQVPLKDGAPIIDPEATPALFLQGVSFDLTLTRALHAPGATGPFSLLDSYQPREWAARFDPATGEVLWRNDATFVPNLALSVLPIAVPSILPFHVAPLSFGAQQYEGIPTMAGTTPMAVDPPYAERNHWSYVPCCFDLTGDGESDLVYATLEWSAHGLDEDDADTIASRLVVFDGSTGELAYGVVTEGAAQRYLHEEIENGYAFFPPFFRFAFAPFFEGAGDVNGDGANDILLHLVYFQEHYRHVLSLRDGTNGSELWRLERPRDFLALPLGDSDDDGGNDLALVEFFDFEFPSESHYHDVNVTVVPIRAVSGADGHLLWSADTRTFNAPLDLRHMLHAFKVGGLPDVNGDGVGDLAVDDPLFLPDLEVVHRQSYRSGRDGTELFPFDAVGQFAVISLPGDLTGDGVDEFALLNGDVIDLWVTMYDGAAGGALWSRRVLTPRIVDFTFAFPMIRFIPLNVIGQPAQETLLNFQFQVTSFGGAQSIESWIPQLTTYESNGTIPWALPELGGGHVAAWVPGVTSGTRAYQNLLEVAGRPTGASVAAAGIANDVAPYAGFFAGGLALALPIGRLWTTWRMKK